MFGGRATKTSIEDWSLSTLSSHIFRQQTQLQLRPGNSNFLFGGRPSWKATGLQLQFGNSRFLRAGPVGRRQGYNCNLGTRDFLVAGPVAIEIFWVAGPVGK